MSLSRLIPLLIIVLTLACRDLSEPSRNRVPSQERFTQAFGDMIVARIDLLPDTIAYRQARQGILDRAGLESEDLERFVARYGSDSDRMAEIYGRIRVRVDSVMTVRAQRGVQEAAPILRETPPAR